MTDDPHGADEEALRWGDESDASHIEARAAASDVPVTVASQTSSAALVTYGVFAGVYALFTAAWIVLALRPFKPVHGVLNEIMYRFGEWLAAAGPGMWGLAVFLLVTTARGRMLWLLIGALVFTPWPYILGAR